MKNQAIRGYYDLDLFQCDTDDDIIKRYSVGFYYPDGGTTGEFMVNLIVLRKFVAPRIEVFDDGCGALLQFTDLVDALYEHSGMKDHSTTPEEMDAIFASCNIKKLK